MNEKNELKRSYEILNGEDDVLLLGKATFTVRRLKELAASQFRKILDIRIKDGLVDFSDMMRELQINEETQIMGGNINWKTSQQGIDCQLLKIGSKGWQKGKIQIEINGGLEFSGKTQTSIKFFPDEPPKQKSPLDDIRQSEEYKKLSNNN
ncbi:MULTISPECIES: KGK domain-containing protein [unclassified Microcoleus]|uniref:KGK domain-containing protein n=1 Tax=unclassified Microcoleus TaxID=2642155 RepID=UPI002FCF4AD8